MNKRQPTQQEKIFAKINLENIQRVRAVQYQTKQTTQSNNGQKTLTDISPKNTHRWPQGTWRDSQHCQLSEKCKSKLQSDITSHQCKWS